MSPDNLSHPSGNNARVQLTHSESLERKCPGSAFADLRRLLRNDQDSEGLEIQDVIPRKRKEQQAAPGSTVSDLRECLQSGCKKRNANLEISRNMKAAALQHEKEQSQIAKREDPEIANFVGSVGKRQSYRTSNQRRQKSRLRKVRYARRLINSIQNRRLRQREKYQQKALKELNEIDLPTNALIVFGGTVNGVPASILKDDGCNTNVESKSFLESVA